MNIKLSVFPKFFKDLTKEQLFELTKEVGLDTTNVIIRDGYWVTAQMMAKELPEFVKSANSFGLDIKFASAGFAPSSLVEDPTPLKIMADNGITEFRLGYFSASADDTRAALVKARADLEALMPLCERANIRAVYQVHHHTLVPGPSGIWPLVMDLPPKFIGVELDPGNQSYEGHERSQRAVHLLNEYLTAIGTKDTQIYKDREHAEDWDKGWRRTWAPIYEGVTNWHELVSVLSEVDFDGTMVFMPFYDENEPAQIKDKLAKEVAYLRKVISDVESQA